MSRHLLLLIAVSVLTASASAADLAVLTEANWDRLAPPGKEADCILGDYVLRNDRVWAVVAQPAAWRNANMTVRQVGGAVIDLTVSERPNDQLSAFYPGMRRQVFTRAEVIQSKGKAVKLVCTALARPAQKEPPAPAQPEVRVEYELEDGQPFLLVRSVFHNPLDTPLDVALEDDLRADNFDKKVPAGPTEVFWVHDHDFEQAYAVVADGHGLRTRSDTRNSVIQYLPEKGDTEKIRLMPGQRYTLVRRLLPGADLLAVKGEAARLRGTAVVPYGWHFVDPRFKPVAGVDVTLKQGDQVYGTARSDAWGWVKAALPRGKYSLRYKAIGRGGREQELDLTTADPARAVHTEYELEPTSAVVAAITDETGGPIPCKVMFKGTGETPNPNWGPVGAVHAVVNLFYSADGRFTVPINPGTYEVVISHGPEYDLVRQPLTVAKGAQVPLQAKLRRAFETPGWVSTDFHSHASPSGDNTSDQRGRVLNLLAEHIEYAPCTEHNRLDSYLPHLKALGAEHRMGTCTGIELTGSPLPLNHQNAFPLILKPRTQDNGGPLTDKEPEVQIRRLAEWDGNAEKLVQQNHPDMGWLFYDKDGDGKPDAGHQAGFAFMHVVEVHPIDDILALAPTRLATDSAGKKLVYNNSIFNWLQLLNQGRRIPGVVNTDAHYNFHGSGGLRNYVRCDNKSLRDIDPLEIVRHCKKGHIVLSTGPFLDVKLQDAIPGDDIRLAGGKGTLRVRVFCPNWFDIDRVQVLVNGRPAAAWNFTRQTHAGLFADQPLRFDHAIELDLKSDAHVIVVAVGEGSELGDVMGPMWGKQHPVAVSNPIYVDVDGNGFQPNRDTLDAPLPVKGGKPAVAAP